MEGLSRAFGQFLGPRRGAPVSAAWRNRVKPVRGREQETLRRGIPGKGRPYEGYR